MNIENQVLQATKVIEKQVDAVIEHIDNLDVNDLESIRKQRAKELKEEEIKKREWLSNGHGKYEELPEEKEFFEVMKKSENVVVHFYTNTNERCKILDMHLKRLARKHIETLFVSLNAEKCSFLAEKLRIKVIPTLVCIHNSNMVDKIVGFTTLGNRDDFSTETLEWRIAQNQVIKYEGDLSQFPDLQKKEEKVHNGRIRDGKYNGEDDDLDIEDSHVNVSDSNTKVMGHNYDLTPEEEEELGLKDD